MNAYVVKTDVFEGPLDLLLQLIEKRKLFINDVSLATVTDDYLSYVESQKKSVGQTANFVLVASTLLLIKSKSLLPVLELTEEEEQSIEDLERRLKLYKHFRELSRNLGDRFGKNILHSGGEKRVQEVSFAPGNDISIKSLRESIEEVISLLPKKTFIPETVVKKVVSLEEMIEKLADRVTRAISTSFKEFAGLEKGDKSDIVVSFLAMLELVKQGAINVRQSGRFYDITMESDGVSVPKY